jgi:ATP-binding cassette subfamily F protein 3
LIELVADQLWLTADGSIKPFAGDMDDYARVVLDRAKAGIASPSQQTADLAEPGAALAEQDSAAARLAARKASKKRRRRGY